MRKKLPKSLRKFLRQEKAKIRRRFLDPQQQKQEIQKLYQKLFNNLHSGNSSLGVK